MYFKFGRIAIKNNCFTSIFVIFGPLGPTGPNCLETLGDGPGAPLTCFRTFLSRLKHLILRWLQGQGYEAHLRPNCSNSYRRPLAYCYRVMGLMSYSWHLIWHIVGAWFGICDLDLECQGGRGHEAPSRPIQQKKKIMGLSLTVTEIWALEVLPVFSIQDCICLPHTWALACWAWRRHVCSIRSMLYAWAWPRLVCKPDYIWWAQPDYIWWARRGMPPCAVVWVSVACAGESSAVQLSL